MTEHVTLDPEQFELCIVDGDAGVWHLSCSEVVISGAVLPLGETMVALALHVCDVTP